MSSSKVHSAVYVLKGGWLRNPVLVKEMLCSSRRRRFYLLRAVYILALALFVMLVWIAQERTNAGSTGGNDVNGMAMVSRMADIGKHVIYSIAWFQYVAAQLVAVILLSNSISGEIQRRTLGPLLTTPVGFFTIALGKAAGGIQHVILLLVCSLPLLALVRVMGGVPWDFLLRSLGLTLAASFLAAAFSLHFSILFRQAYAVMIMSVLSLAAYHLLAWLLWPIGIALVLMKISEKVLGRFLAGRIGLRVAHTICVYSVVIGLYALWIASGSLGLSALFNPTMGMILCGESMLSPGSVGISTVFVAASVGATAAASLFFLWRSSRRLAGIASTKGWGDEGIPSGHRGPIAAKMGLRAVPPPKVDSPSDVVAALDRMSPDGADVPEALYGQCERFGSPVVWRELRGAMISSDIIRFFVVFLPVGLACVMYFAMLVSHSFGKIGTHAFVLTSCLCVGGLLTAVLSGMTIASERQGRTWPILQTTALSSWQILWGKALGVFLRVLPVWLVLLGHVVLFTVLGQIDAIVLVHATMIIVATSLFLCGSGFLISTFVRQATVSAASTLGLAAVLWLLVPMLGQLALQAGGSHTDLSSMSPIHHIQSVVIDSPGPFSGDHASYLLSHVGNTVSHLAVSLITLVVYGGAGGLMAFLAARRFRKKAF